MPARDTQDKRTGARRTTHAWWPAILVAMLVLPAWAQPIRADKDCQRCPVILPVEPGSFLMGSPAGEEEREGLPEKNRGSAVPQHEVTIGYRFWMARTPVTRDEFADFVTATGHVASRECAGYEINRKMSGHRRWQRPGFEQRGDHPVVCVSWDDATAYVKWLSSATGKKYRLPSEAEWEYVARAGTKTARFWGDGRDEACRHANVRDQSMRAAFKSKAAATLFFSCQDSYAHTSPVASFAGNPWGFHDMLGNVWQWTEDCRHDTYEGAPTDGRPWAASEGAGTCGHRVLRGSSWFFPPGYVRAAERQYEPPAEPLADLGFRVARDD